jgi:hypothetical protein
MGAIYNEQLIHDKEIKTVYRFEFGKERAYQIENPRVRSHI